MNTTLGNRCDMESELYANTGHAYSVHVNYIEMTVEIAVTNLNTKRRRWQRRKSRHCAATIDTSCLYHPVNSCLVVYLLACRTVTVFRPTKVKHHKHLTVECMPSFTNAL